MLSHGADSMDQKYKFLHAVSNLVKIECKNAMLLGDITISRPMTHAQQFEGNKLKEHAKENKKARTWNYDSGGRNLL